jgi:hypothetical protein
VPFVDAEVEVELVGDREPGDLPAHPRPVALDVRLRGAGDEDQRRVAGVEVGDVGDLVGDERAASAAALRPAADAGLEEEPIDDQLAAAGEEVEQACRPVWSLEPVVLLDRHPRHPAPFGGERVASAGQLLLLDQELVAGGLPLLGRYDGGAERAHFSSSFR